MSDHGALRYGGVPYLFLCCGHGQHYHSEQDTPDRLSYRKMASITRLVIALMEVLDSTVMRQTGSEQFGDTLEKERECFPSALGQLYWLLLRRRGVGDIAKHRRDLLACA